MDKKYFIRKFVTQIILIIISINIPGCFHYPQPDSLKRLTVVADLSATTISADEILVTWKNNGSNIDGCILERSEDKNTFTKLTFINPDASSYTDRAVNPGKTFYYRLQKYTLLFFFSDYSNIASTSTPSEILKTGPGVYYVDIAGIGGLPDDTRTKAQNSITTPWKTIQRAMDLASPGDTIYIRAGIYREETTVKTSGTENSFITYKAYPGEKVIIDGSIPVILWTQCTSALNCGGNPNWANIYYADIPGSITALSANVYEDETLLSISQDPLPINPLYWNRASNNAAGKWYDCGTTAGYMINGSTQITDPTFFTQADPTYWDNSYVFVLSGNNNAFPRKINTYTPSTGTITYNTTTTNLSNQDTFSVWNNINLMTVPGTYYVDEINHRLYLWPNNTVNLTNGKISISVLNKNGINLNNESYQIIDGLIIRRFSASNEQQYWSGCGIISSTTVRSENVVIKNCEVKQLGSWGISAIYPNNINNLVIYNNYVHDNPVLRGISSFGPSSISGGGVNTGLNHVSNIVMKDNVVRSTGGTAFYTQFAKNIVMSTNKHLDSQGQHANSYSAYNYCNNVIMDRNIAANVEYAIITFQQKASNVIITNNVLTTTLTGVNTYGVIAWDGNGSNLIIDHNTVINYYGPSAIKIPQNSNHVRVTNNIVYGIELPMISGELVSTDYTLLNNLYLISFNWTMTDSLKGDGGLLIDVPTKIFVDYANQDYRLKSGTIAATMSTDGGYVGALPPVD